MKTKKGSTPDTGKKASVTEISQEPTAATAESSYRPGSRLAVALKEDGSFDLEAMRASTTEKILKAVQSTPSLFPQSPGTSSNFQFPPQVIWTMYGAMGAMESLLAQRVAKVPREIADKIFPYTAQELEILTPPTSRVLAKYATGWMMKYADEISLASLLMTITVNKINAAMALSRAQGPRQAEVVEMPKKEEDDPKPVPN